MSNSVDRRVVEMRFDNGQFEQGVKTTLTTLEKLKSSLHLENAVDGFNKVADSAKVTSLNAMAAGIEAIQNRFSTLGIIGMRVLENLTDAAMNFAKSTWSYVTDAIIGGGKRRAFNIENAHFQLQGLLKDEQKVQAIMDDAMDSVDGTAYAYDEAAKAASQFAASGLTAGKEMQSALRAITGVAAMTNSEYEDISRVFTTVAGNGRLMGDQLLQLSSRGLNAAASLVDFFNGVGNGSISASEDVTAAVKALTGGLDVTEQDIREWVSKGKISFRVFSAAMDDAFGEHAKKANETVTGSLSNVRAAFARIGADFVSPLIEQNGPLVQFFNAIRVKVNELRKGTKLLSQMFSTTANSVITKGKELIEGLDLSKPIAGFYNLVYAAMHIFESLKSIAKPIAKAFSEIFPAITGEQFVSFTRSIERFTDKLKLSGEAAETVHRIFKGFFAGVDIIRQFIRALIKGIVELVQYFAPAAGGLLDFVAGIGDYISNLRDGIIESDAFGKAISKVVNFIINFSEEVKTRFNQVKEWAINAKDAIVDFYTRAKEKIVSFPWVQAFVSLLKNIVRHIGETIKGIKDFKDNITSSMSAASESITKNKFVEIITGIGKVIGGVLKSIWEAFKKIGSAFTEKLGNADFIGFFDLFYSVLTALATFEFTNLISGINISIQRISYFGSKIKYILGNIGWSLKKFGALVQAEAILKIGEAILVLAAGLLLLSSIDSTALAQSAAVVTALLAELVSIMAIMTKMEMPLGDNPIMQIFSRERMFGQLSTNLIKLSAAILILSIAMKSLADLDWNGLAKGLVGVTVLLGELTLVMLAMKKMGGGKSAKGATSLILLATALNILIPVVKAFAALDWTGVGKAVVGIGALLAELTLYSRFSKSNVGASTGIVILASGLLILMKSIQQLAEMDIPSLSKAVVALGALLIELSAYTQMSKSNIGSSTGLVILASGLLILMGSLKEIADMNPSSLAQGLVGLGAILLELSAYANMTKSNIGSSTGLVIFAAGLTVLMGVVKDLAAMPWKEASKGLTVLGILLLELVAALNGMSGTLGASAALVVATLALAGLYPVLKAFGSMKTSELIQGLAGLAGIFVTLGIAGMALGPLTGTIVALSGAITLMGAGLALAGVGILAASVGIDGLAVSLGALSVSLVSSAESIVLVLKVFFTALLDIIPTILVGLKKFLVSAANVFIEAAPAWAKAINALVMSILRDLDIAGILASALELIYGVLDALSQNVPGIIDRLLTLFEGILHSLAEHMPALVVAGVEVIKGFVSGLKQAFDDISVVDLAEFILAAGAFVLIFRILAASVKDVLQAAVAVGLMVALLASITVAFVALGKIDAVTTLANAASISAVMLAMAGVMRILNGLPISAALKAIAEMDLMIANMALVMTALGALYQIPGLERLINDGAKFLEDIGEGIGAFVGSIVGGFAKGVSDSFPAIADNLSAFGQKIQPFLDAMGSVDAGVIDAVSAITTAMLKMTAAELLDQISKWIGSGDNSLVKFGEELVEFAPLIKEYADEVKGLDTGIVAASARCASMIADFADKVPRTGGWLQKITGENSIAKFGEELVAFAPNLMAYAESIKGLNTSAVEKSVSAATMITDFTSKVKPSGGWLQKITGENSIAKFGEELAAFGPNLMTYADEVKGLDASVVEKSASAADMLIDLANKLPKTGGAVQWLKGEGDMSDFGDGLVSFGEGLAGYSDAISTINTYKVTQSAEAVSALVDISNSIGDYIGSSMTIGDFGGKLSTFGSGLYEYWVSISSISIPAVSAMTAEIDKIIDVANNLTSSSGDNFKSFTEGLKGIGESGIDGFVAAVENGAGKLQSAATKMMTTFISAVESKKALVTVAFGAIITSVLDNFDKFSVSFLGSGTKLAQSFVDGIKLKTTAISTSFTNTISTTLTTINSKGTSFQTAGSGLIGKLIDGIKSKSAAAKTEMTQIVNTIATAVTGKYSTFITLGQNLMSNFISGIRSNNGASYAFTSGLSGAVGQARGYYTSFYNAGYYLVQGFANGIDKNTWRAKAKAIAMAQAALDGANSRLRINSPSKETFQTGYYTAMGLVNALVKFSRNVYNAGYNMASSAMSGLQSAISTVGSMIDDALDAEPTIRPIMDLSEIQNGTNRLANMVSAVDGFEVNGSVGIASMTAATIKNAKIATEVDPTMAAFDDLKAALSGMSGSTTYENTFNITGDNPREIANEVSRIMQMQVERRAASWA